MRFGLSLIFVAFPLLELALLIRTGQLIGLWPTLAIVVVTAALGGIILHRQGFAMVGRVSQAVEQGEPVVEPAIDGLFLVVAGALLIAPGLITDTVGLLLLIPPLRRRIGRWCLNALMASPDVHVRIFTSRRQGPGARGPSSKRPKEDGPIIEGEFGEVNEKTPSRSLPRFEDGNRER
jgi:UPF0716 protein FxsA